MRPGAGEGKEKLGGEAEDGGEAPPTGEEQAPDRGLSEAERIGRSLDEVSDIIHNVLSEPKSGGGGEKPPGASGGQSAGSDAGRKSGIEAAAEARQDEPVAGESGPEAGESGGGDAADRVRQGDAAAGEAGPEAGEAGGGDAADSVRQGDAAAGESGPEAGEAGGGDAAPDPKSKNAGAGLAAEKADGRGADGTEPGGEDRIPGPVIESILGPSEADGYGGGGGQGGRTYSYDDFIDERVLISRDAFGRKEMKIKVLEVSDEKAPTSWKLGDRVKVDKILVTVKHLETQQVEEREFDIESIEKEIARDRHYSSTNRWVPTTDIKNGYVAGSRHTSLISDAVALDYIIF